MKKEAINYYSCPELNKYPFIYMLEACLKYGSNELCQNSSKCHVALLFLSTYNDNIKHIKISSMLLRLKGRMKRKLLNSWSLIRMIPYLKG